MGKIQKIYVVAFIYDDNQKILIAKRNFKSEFLPNHYELPGGKVEFGEEPVIALKREIMEELNVSVDVLQPYHTFSFTHENGTVHGVEIAFFAKLKDDKIKINLVEHESISWVTKNELDKYKISTKEKEAMIIGFNKLDKII